MDQSKAINNKQAQQWAFHPTRPTMEPFYIYITALTLIAAKLIYDSTIRKRKATRLYLDICDMRLELEKLMGKSDLIAMSIVNTDKIEQSYENLRTYRQLQLDMYHIINKLKDMETRLAKLTQHIPNYSANYLDYELRFPEHISRKEKEIHAAHKEFLKSAKFHVVAFYTPHSLPMLKLAAYILNEVGDLKLNSLDLEIDCATLFQTIEKLELNQKLQHKLPPKPKAKVNKI